MLKHSLVVVVEEALPEPLEGVK
jgi:hypothetical protein